MKLYLQMCKYSAARCCCRPQRCSLLPSFSIYNTCKCNMSLLHNYLSNVTLHTPLIFPHNVFFFLMKAPPDTFCDFQRLWTARGSLPPARRLPGPTTPLARCLRRLRRRTEEGGSSSSRGTASCTGTQVSSSSSSSSSSRCCRVCGCCGS